MKGAKELAGIVRERMEHDGGYVPVFTEDAVDILAHLDRLAAIDSAVPGEVGEIAKHHDHCFIRGAKEPENGQLLAWYRAAKIADSHRATLLAIIQRGAVALRQTIRDELLDAARAEVERIQALVDEFKAASMLDVNGDPDGVTPRLLEGHVTSLQTEVERLRTERATLAQENARMINEVGELDAAAREQMQRAEVLARGVAAYRTGSFTLAQVWENEEGKAVK